MLRVELQKLVEVFLLNPCEAIHVLNLIVKLILNLLQLHLLILWHHAATCVKQVPLARQYDADKIESILYQVGLYLQVKWRFKSKRWR